MDVMNIQTSIIAHLQWKAKLSDFFYGVEELTLADVPDHTHCDFGKLLYSTLLEEFRDFSDMPLLERLHKEVHDDIKRLVQLPPETRKSPQGRQKLDAFRDKCDKLVQIMENLEAQAKATA